MKFKRYFHLASTLLILWLGLASREYSDLLPEFVTRYAGDTLWAAMIYSGIRFLFFPISIPRATIGSLFFSYSIEVSQLYQASWANIVRGTRPGALIFGHGFLWSDMICYTVGILLSAGIDYYFHFSFPKDKTLSKKKQE